MNLANASDKAEQALPVFLANYAKRFLETIYDRAIQTGFGQKMVALSPAKKYTLEAILYALTAFFESRLRTNSKLAKFLREVGVDMAPEISKRIINGIKQEMAVIAAEATNPMEKDLLDVLLSLGDSDLSGFIRWLSQTSLERDKIFNQLSLLSAEQVAKILKLPDAEKDQFLKFFGPEEKERADQKSVEPRFGEVFRQDMAEAAERLKQTKERMRQKRQGGKQ